MIPSVLYSLRKAAATAQGLTEDVRSTLRILESRVAEASVSDADTADILRLAAVPNELVRVASLQVTALHASGTALGRELVELVQQGLNDPGAAVRSAAVNAASWMIVTVDAEIGGAFVRACADGAVSGPSGSPDSVAWLAQEACVMALAAAVRARRSDDSLRRAIVDFALGVLPACLAATSVKYVRGAAMHLCASIIESWTLDELQRAELRGGAMHVVAAIASVASGDGGRETRYAASVALRAVVSRWPGALFETTEFAAATLRLLLPPLVLARYYGPERQRLYCVGTWRLVVAELERREGGKVASVESHSTSSSMGASIGSSGLLGPVPEQRPGGAAASDRAASPSRSRSLSCALLDSQLLAEGTASGALAAAHTTAARAPWQSVAPALPSTRPSSPARCAAPPCPESRAAAPDRGGRSAGDACSPSAVTASGIASSVPATVSGVGPALVAAHMAIIADYFLGQLSGSDEDAREAAAHCVAELTAKVDSSSVAPFATAFVDALGSACIDTASWSCRDASAVAIAKVLVAFQAAFLMEAADKAAGILASLLGDEHRTVRDHAAVALVEVSRSFAALHVTAARTAESIVSAIASAAGGSDPATHRWHLAAGAVCLLRELAAVDAAVVSTLVGPLLSALSMPEAPLWPREILCRALPELCTRLGKPRTKRVLDELLGILTRAAAECAAPLGLRGDRGVAFAVADAVAFLRQFVGPSIFDGHLSPAQAETLALAATAGVAAMRDLSRGNVPLPVGLARGRGDFDNR